MRPPTSRTLATLALALAGLIGSLPAAMGQNPPPPQACDNPTRSMSLFADNIGRKRIGYGTRPDNITSPGPTIVMTEGECLQITLINDTDQRLSLHVHGVHYTVRSDGTPLNSSCVAPGRSRTYVWEAPGPTSRADGTIDPGTAGYWHYHDHCMGSSHGTGGVRKGLFGALIVRRAGDPVPDRPPFVVVFKDLTINNRKAPNTPTFTANLGERVEFVVIGHGDLMHTFHLHGHRWTDNRTGSPASLTDATQIIDNRTVGPADSFGFQVIAGEGVGPGAWMYHCHVQGHSDGGMSGLFLVRTPEGMLTQETRAALQKWKQHDALHH